MKNQLINPPVSANAAPMRKTALLPLERIAEAILDRRKDLRPDRRAGFPDGGCKPDIMAAERRREALGGAEEGRDAGAHFAEGVEDAVEDDEEREDGLDGVQGAANDEAHYRPAEEAEGHGLFSANAVH